MAETFPQALGPRRGPRSVGKGKRAQLKVKAHDLDKALGERTAQYTAFAPCAIICAS